MQDDTIASLGTILGVWAHPDDEAFLSAGIMTTAVAQGQRVVCVTATRGEKGFPDDDPRPSEERAALRVEELAECLAILGVDDHRWLDYPDGGLVEVDERKPVDELVAIIDEVQPDTVLTFGPDGMTGHFDHMTVSRWTTLAVEAVRPDANLLYATKTPAWAEEFVALTGSDLVMMDDAAEIPSTPPEQLALHVELDDDLLDVKLRALLAQASQIQPTIDEMGMDAVTDFNREEFFRTPRDDDWPGH
jgi:LmbE family N-acetylglucosaminyl deacetylase